MEEKNVKKMGNKRKFRIGKIVIKDIKRFSISVIIFITSIILLCILISNLTDKKIEKDADLSSVNANKHYEELLEKYEQTSMMQLFLTDYEKIQDAVGLYIINNSTMEEDSFEKIIKKINKTLSKDDWKEELEISKPTTWNGSWSVDGDGIVKFKFSNKSIEPSWIVNDNIPSKVIRN